MRLSSRSGVAWCVFLAALFLYLGTTGGSFSTTDANAMFELTRSLVERQSIALSGDVLGLEADRGVDGRYYSQFGIGESIYDIPFYVAGRAAERVIGTRIGKRDSLLKAAVCTSRAVAAAGTVATVFLLALAIIGRSRPALIAAALAGGGSLLWPYARFGFNAPLTAWLVAGMALFLWRGVHESRRSLIVSAGMLGGLGWLTRHEFPILILPMAVWLAITPSRAGAVRRLGAFLPGVVIGGAAWAMYNIERFGHPLSVGFQPAYTGEGYFGLLFSPSGSVFLYWPAVLLCAAGLIVLARTTRPAVRLLTWPVLTTFLYVGLMHDWPGGRSYGPRYLVPVLPLLTVGAGVLYAHARAVGRRALVAALVVAAVIQLPGVLVDYSRVSQSWAQTVSPEVVQNRLYIWRAAPILLNTRAAIAAIGPTAAYLSGRARLPPIERQAADGDRGFSQQFAFSLDFWWLYLFYLHALPAGAALLLGTLLWTASAGFAIHAWRVAS